MPVCFYLQDSLHEPYRLEGLLKTARGVAGHPPAHLAYLLELFPAAGVTLPPGKLPRIPAIPPRICFHSLQGHQGRIIKKFLVDIAGYGQVEFPIFRLYLLYYTFYTLPEQFFEIYSYVPVPSLKQPVAVYHTHFPRLLRFFGQHGFNPLAVGLSVPGGEKGL